MGHKGAFCTRKTWAEWVVQGQEAKVIKVERVHVKRKGEVRHPLSVGSCHQLPWK